MTSFEASAGQEATSLPAPRSAVPGVSPQSPLERVHGLFTPESHPQLAEAIADSRSRADRLVAGVGAGKAAEGIAALAYASDAIVALAAEGDLVAGDVHAAAHALAEAFDLDLAATRCLLFSRTIASPRLLELPPLAAAGVQLRLLIDLGLFHDVSLWQRAATGDVECVLHLGNGEPGRRTRTEARAVLRGRTALHLIGRSSLRSSPIVRFHQVVGAVVGHAAVEDRDRTNAYMGEVALALAPILERELLLERSRARERALVASAERRLMRLAFDLHDGPIQDVLALAGEVRQFQRELYPFVHQTHQELADGRFDDVTAHLIEIDRVLREIAHSLESKSIVSRPLGEILHREVDAFTERSGIETRLELRGDPESLNSSQRIAIFRAIQEALANVREHSGATLVEIRLRARRNSIDVRISDNGTGFEVSRALARAAKRGRLGLVGIGERVRMLGGTFDVDSQPGGPTTLTFTLPRSQPAEQSP